MLKRNLVCDIYFAHFSSLPTVALPTAPHDRNTASGVNNPVTSITNTSAFLPPIFSVLLRGRGRQGAGGGVEPPADALHPRTSFAGFSCTMCGAAPMGGDFNSCSSVSAQPLRMENGVGQGDRGINGGSRLRGAPFMPRKPLGALRGETAEINPLPFIHGRFSSHSFCPRQRAPFSFP